VTVDAPQGVRFEPDDMEKDVFVGPYNPIVVNTGAKLVLIDTGTGEAAFKSSNGMNGQLLTNLAAAGLDPAAFRSLCRDMQIIFQDPFASLNPRKRVGQIISMPLRLHGEDRGEVDREPARRARAAR